MFKGIKKEDEVYIRSSYIKHGVYTVNRAGVKYFYIVSCNCEYKFSIETGKLFGHLNNVSKAYKNEQEYLNQVECAKLVNKISRFVTSWGAERSSITLTKAREICDILGIKHEERDYSTTKQKE